MPQTSPDSPPDSLHAPCAVCGEDRPQPAYPVHDLIWDDPTPWQFVRCGGCGHGYLDPQPTPAALTALYEGLYTPDKLDLMVKIGEGSFDRRLQRERARAISGVVDKPVGRILDVGCGVGFSLQVLAKLLPEAEAIGVEMAGPAADKADELPEITVLKQPFMTLELEDDSVDVLCMNHLLEHLSDPRPQLSRAAELVRPGGLIEIEIPQLEGWARSAFGRWYWCHLPPQHLQLFHLAGLTRLLSESGFSEMVKVERTGYPINLTVTMSLFIKHTVGSSSRFARNWLIRGPVMLAGILAIPLTLLFDATIGILLNWTRGDILRVIARRDG
ncbi:MAG: ubiquinone/menaquinone biosynthesis C-methylase UbiE [Myxococcota bacterium]|jgi:ubiquinone/menaquinone biosynthesis C-methylase UbiE